MIFDFRKAAAWLDDHCRLLDLHWERLQVSPLGFLGVERENVEAFVWPALIAAAFWTGMPTMNHLQLIGLLVGAAAAVLLIFINGKSRTAGQDLFVQVVFFFALGGIIWIVGPDEAGTGSLVYRHLLIPVALLVGVSLLLSVFLARQLLQPLQQISQYADYLQRTELFQSRGERIRLASSSIVEVILSVSALLLRPLEFLLPVAAAVLLSPPAYLRFWAILIASVMVWILALSAYDDRLDHSFRLIARRFSRNAALLVSLLALALAAARLFHNTYVTTVFDTASGLEILLYFVAAYALAWWYDYWTERILGQQLFLLIDPAAGGNCATAYSYRSCTYTTVPKDERSVELHGLGRMLVYRPNPGKWPYFQAWSWGDLFAQLGSAGAPGGKAVPLPQQITQRTTLYLGSTALITVGLVAGGAWLLHDAPKNAELRTQTGHSTGLRLAQLLEQKNPGDPEPAILVAASGGGTRAAVFAGAVLEGLSETQGSNIRAGSGVSGGSAAIAFYAAKRKDLVTGSEQAWNDYFNRMTMPFIRDVIERAQEWRMALHGRDGILLAESFERHWGLDGYPQRFGEISGFGLICNSTLAGRFDRCFLKPYQTHGLSLAQAAARYHKYTRSDVAGGRIIMTNLDLQGVFSGPEPPFIPGMPLPIVIDDRSIRIQRAAALSANFPPVFSDAAIDVDEQAGYWVTDGGAADNRGLEPLLFALRAALRTGVVQPAQLPPVTLVIIEASGIDDSFEQNRGIGSTLGAGAHFADQLDKELYDELTAMYRAAGSQDKLGFYYIAMPRILRTSGSFGTHWMLQDHIDVRNGSVSKSFSGERVVRALRAAYGCRDAGDADELTGWIRSSPEFSQWCAMHRSLAPGNTRAFCGCSP